MARIIAIDYGTKRSGLAVTDSLQMIASPLDTVQTEKLLEYLKDYFQREEVELILLGDPKKLNNTGSEMTHLTNRFAQKLKHWFPDKPLVRIDERLTSVMAMQAMTESGQSKKVKNDKGMLDRVSAAILLQQYLASKTI
jgi:putative Holliday junction resolvase